MRIKVLVDEAEDDEAGLIDEAGIRSLTVLEKVVVGRDKRPHRAYFCALKLAHADLYSGLQVIIDRLFTCFWNKQEGPAIAGPTFGLL